MCKSSYDWVLQSHKTIDLNDVSGDTPTPSALELVLLHTPKKKKKKTGRRKMGVHDFHRIDPAANYLSISQPSQPATWHYVQTLAFPFAQANSRSNTQHHDRSQSTKAGASSCSTTSYRESGSWLHCTMFCSDLSSSWYRLPVRNWGLGYVQHKG